MLAGIGAVIACGMPGPIAQAPTTSSSSARKIAADQHADRQILQEALPELGEVDVEHHHHEQEQHRDRADIDHDQDHRQEFGAHQHEQPGGVDEGEDEKQHRMHRVARGDHHEGARHANAGEEIEEQRRTIMRGSRSSLPACGERVGVRGLGRISCVTDKPPHPTALRAVDLSPRAGRGKR